MARYSRHRAAQCASLAASGNFQPFACLFGRRLHTSKAHTIPRREINEANSGRRLLMKPSSATGRVTKSTGLPSAHGADNQHHLPNENMCSNQANDLFNTLRDQSVVLISIHRAAATAEKCHTPTNNCRRLERKHLMLFKFC
jgi:hypothetical protein